MDFLEMSMDINKLKKFTAGLFDKIEGNRKRLNTHTVTKTDYDLDQKGIVKLISKLEIKLNNALEKGTAVAFHGIYHETINNRIRAICDALEMDLNGHKSPKITALENRLSGSENITSEQFTKLQNTLQDFMEIVDITITDNVDGESLDYYREKKRELLEKFNSKKDWTTENLMPEIKEALKEVDCLHEFLLEAHWSGNARLRCNKCGLEADFHEKTKQALKNILKEHSVGEKSG